MIAKASHPRSQTHRKTSPAPETEAEAEAEAELNYSLGHLTPHRRLRNARDRDGLVGATRWMPS